MSLAQPQPESGLGQVDRAPTLADQAYEQVKTAILHGQLAPGSRSTEAGVARSLGISRAPLREALRRLDEEGFVEPTGRAGFAVAELTPETIRETYEVRLSLESSAMRYAFDHIPSTQVAEALSGQRRLAQRLKRHEVRAFSEFSESDLLFHDLWVRHCGNSMLIRHIDRLRDHVIRVQRQAPLPVAHTIASSQEHLLILDAISSGSAQLARDMVEEHIAGVGQRIAAAFNEAPEPTAASSASGA